MNREGLRIERSGELEQWTIDRPDRRNAFDEAVCEGLIEAAAALPHDVRVVVLTGSGGTFCAGADLGWFAEASSSENAARARLGRVSAMFIALDALPIPLVARVNGPALGGGVGLVALADVAVAADTATFQLAEIRVGMIPAMIAPYVIRRIGPGRTREWALTGEPIGAERARGWGLTETVVPARALDGAVDRAVAALAAGAPGAQASLKAFLRGIENRPPADAAADGVAASAARLAGPEAAARIGRFLGKRTNGSTRPDR
jgi:methylglutaconyl-CoA hydratase